MRTHILLLSLLLVAGVPAASLGADPAPESEPAAMTEPTDAEDQFWRGFNLLHGRGVPADPAAATEWFRRAGEQGHERSQVHMGMAYLKGRGVPVDRSEALEWFLLAAEQGHSKAQLEAGQLLLDGGGGIRRDPVEGGKWLLLSLSQGGVMARATVPARLRGLGKPRLEQARARARAWRDAHLGEPADAPAPAQPAPPLAQPAAPPAT